MTNHRINPDLLKRYLEGKTTPEEAELVEKWYANLNPDLDEHHFDQSQHFRKVKEAIRSIESDEPDTHVVISISSVMRYVSAAMVLIACAMGVYLYNSRMQNSAFEEKISLTSVVNTGKQIHKQQLPDGSTIWLQPGARLAYNASQFTSVGRDVNLEGDAFFDVARDESRPFTVLTRDLRIKVLGTSFHVKAAAGELRPEVTVISGKVMVPTPRQAGNLQEVALLPAQKVVLEVATGELIADIATPENSPLQTWQPASLQFSDNRLEEVARRLEEKFNVSIKLESHTMGNCLMTAAFEDLQLSEILETISIMLELTYEVEGETILLRGNGC